MVGLHTSSLSVWINLQVNDIRFGRLGAFGALLYFSTAPVWNLTSALLFGLPWSERCPGFIGIAFASKVYYGPCRLMHPLDFLELRLCMDWPWWRWLPNLTVRTCNTSANY